MLLLKWHVYMYFFKTKQKGEVDIIFSFILFCSFHCLSLWLLLHLLLNRYVFCLGQKIFFDCLGFRDQKKLGSVGKHFFFDTLVQFSTKAFQVQEISKTGYLHSY